MNAGAGGATINPVMMGNRVSSSSVHLLWRPTDLHTHGQGTGSPNSANPTTTATPMSTATPPNAPRGPAAMRQPPTGPAAGVNGGAAGGPAGGQGQPARYSTQGQARSRPY